MREHGPTRGLPSSSLSLGASCLGGEGDLSGWSRPGVVDPDFGGDGLESKAEPECRAEELVWIGSIPAKHRRGKENTDDRTNGGHGESDGVAANHPLAMLRKFASQRMPKRPPQRNQEKRSEEHDGSLFIHAADGFSVGQSQPADSHNRTGSEENASRPAVHLRIARPQAAPELQGSQNHKKHGRQDVRQHQGTFAREMRVQVRRGIPRRTQSTRLEQNDRSPGGDHKANKSEKDDRNPKESDQHAVRIRSL